MLILIFAILFFLAFICTVRSLASDVRGFGDWLRQSPRFRTWCERRRLAAEAWGARVKAESERAWGRRDQDRANGVDPWAEWKANRARRIQRFKDWFKFRR